MITRGAWAHGGPGLPPARSPGATTCLRSSTARGGRPAASDQHRARRVAPRRRRPHVDTAFMQRLSSPRGPERGVGDSDERSYGVLVALGSRSSRAWGARRLGGEVPRQPRQRQRSVGSRTLGKVGMVDRPDRAADRPAPSPGGPLRTTGAGDDGTRRLARRPRMPRRQGRRRLGAATGGGRVSRRPSGARGRQPPGGGAASRSGHAEPGRSWASDLRPIVNASCSFERRWRTSDGARCSAVDECGLHLGVVSVASGTPLGGPENVAHPGWWRTAR